jgi:hypothetical protein
LAGYPLDLAKVRLQAQSIIISPTAATETIPASVATTTASPAPAFTGVFDCLKKTIRHGVCHNFSVYLCVTYQFFIIVVYYIIS